MPPSHPPPGRRRALGTLAAAGLWSRTAAGAAAAPATPSPTLPFVRTGSPLWPSDQAWAGLRSQVGEALLRVRSPWEGCRAAPDGEACRQLFESLKNPYFLGDEVALTQTLGWVGAWTSSPSPYAVAARSAADVAAAVHFARRHRLRLVVKGGGHSYQGTSNAADSLLVWTRHLDAVQLHDAFVPAGCRNAAPVRAASIGAGAIWAQAYDAVTTRGGGYVQGGGCLTVGVGGLVQSGGFGSFSKQFGLAAASLLEAEVVTADGAVRIVNQCAHPDLFWALKGGGGGSFGILTRVTLQVHALPETFGAVNFTVRASSPAAFQRLIRRTLDHCAEHLVNPHWGEQIRFRPGNVLVVSMVFQGLRRSQAVEIWEPFRQSVSQAPDDYTVDFAPLAIVTTSARSFWSPTLLKRMLGFIRRDERPGAPETHVFWPGDQGQAGQFLHGYCSTWLPAALLEPARRGALADALFEGSRHWGVSLHFNKGLAGAPPAAIAAARDTAVHPAAIDAFALAISGAEEQPAYPGVAGHEPDAPKAARSAAAIARCHGALRTLVPEAASYLAESDYFERHWQQAFWGANHARLAAIKARYDPERLFTVHHGVGSEG